MTFRTGLGVALAMLVSVAAQAQNFPSRPITYVVPYPPGGVTDNTARTMAKAFDGAPHETLLVLDATNGQNAMQQAAMFKEALPLSGIVLTKLDGTAKGGVILGICAEQQLAVRYVGIGEQVNDLMVFDPESYVNGLFN